MKCLVFLMSSVWSSKSYRLRPGDEEACLNLPVSPPRWTWPEVERVAVGGRGRCLYGWIRERKKDVEVRELCWIERPGAATSMWGQIKCGVKWKVFTLHFLHLALSLLSRRLQIYVTGSLFQLPVLMVPSPSQFNLADVAQVTYLSLFPWLLPYIVHPIPYSADDKH